MAGRYDADDDVIMLWAYRLLFYHYLDLLETFLLIQSYDAVKSVNFIDCF